MSNKVKYPRPTELAWFIIISLILCFAFFGLNRNFQQTFDEVNENYRNRTAINLNYDFDTQRLAYLLVENSPIDEQSAEFIAEHIKTVLERGAPLPNLGQLNTRRFQIPVLKIDSLLALQTNDRHFRYLRTRVENARNALGITDELPNIDTISTEPDFDSGNSEIRVKVQQTEQSTNPILRRLGFDRTIPVDSVLVQLVQHSYNETAAVDERVVADTLGFAKTNAYGIATFKGLDCGGFFSVRPIRDGFEYGVARGTTRGDSLGAMSESDRTFTFTQREHRIAPLDFATFLTLRNNHIITARTPQEFQNAMTRSLIVILLAWWALHLFLAWRKRQGDQFLLPLLMFLTGMCVLTMYSIQNPLTDLMHGSTMTQGVLAGVVMIFVLSNINMVSFFNNRYTIPFDPIDAVVSAWRWLLKPYKAKLEFIHNLRKKRKIYNVLFLVFIPLSLLLLPLDLLVGVCRKIAAKFPQLHKFKIPKLPEGTGYLVLALIITALLFPFGTGPAGSGVRVELFFFQPSEIAKYLIVLFLAAFFYRNAEKIQTFSQKSKIVSRQIQWRDFKIQFRTIIVVMISIAVLLGMYLVLGDMGPALVIAITFIIIYSVVRGDLIEFVVGVASFLLLLFAALWVGVPLFVGALVWLALWICYSRWRKQLFESAVFFNFVVAAFIFAAPLLNTLGLDSQAQRLEQRNEIFVNTWNNEVRGGDHVAQALWGLASGGMFGQGLGEGNPNLVPAHHTDMIFTSIGEEMGWIGLLFIIFVLALLMYRSMLAGKRNGNPFAFYLAAGIAIVTGVQFLVITLGSVGVIPLTGVAVPFLSFGRVSMIMNMAAFGIIFAISQNRATRNQEERIEKKYGLMIETCKYAYSLAALVLLGTLFYYQFSIGSISLGRNQTLIKPALMANTQGQRMVVYNPRISVMMRALDAGNIYDRNGLLLATNDREQVRENLRSFIDAGIAEEDVNRRIRQHRRRYYPFGEHLFFWLGDFNQQHILWGENINDPRGYIAERRHLAALRGFERLQYDENDEVKLIHLDARAQRASPFLPPTERSDIRFVDYDYSFLLPFLKAGVNSRRVERFNNRRERDRDITLTVDATLQTRMQKAIADYVASNPNFNQRMRDRMRVSVVVMNAQNGHLLASANYPLPCMNTLWERRNVHFYSDSRNNAYTDRDLGLTRQTQPGSTAKIISAMAGLQGLGVSARNERYFTHSQEVVGIEPTGWLTMRDAIVRSSNVYFINLLNDHNLYGNLADIYWSVGVGLDIPNQIRFTPYFFTPNDDNERRERFRNHITSTGEELVRRYDDYIEQRAGGNFERMAAGRNNPRWLQEHAWAWGQGTMQATPLNMARVAAIVANDGVLVETQFVKEGNRMLRVPRRPQTTQILARDEARVLADYMRAETARYNVGAAPRFPEAMGIGGKTGTAQRGTGIGQGMENDGWYMFFVPSSRENAPLAVAVRMERIGTGLAGAVAVPLTREVVVSVLREMGYVE